MHVHILIFLEVASFLLFEDLLAVLIDLLDFENKSDGQRKVVGYKKLRLEVYDALAALGFDIHNEPDGSRDELHRSTILIYVVLVAALHLVDAEIIAENLTEALCLEAVNTHSLYWYLMQFLDACYFQIYRQSFVFDEILCSCKLVLLPLSLDFIELCF